MGLVSLADYMYEFREEKNRGSLLSWIRLWIFTESDRYWAVGEKVPFSPHHGRRSTAYIDEPRSFPATFPYTFLSQPADPHHLFLLLLQFHPNHLRPIPKAQFTDSLATAIERFGFYDSSLEAVPGQELDRGGVVMFSHSKSVC